MSDMIEIWKPVVGWEDRYMVSNLGRVKSLDRWVKCKNGSTRLYKGRILNGCINNMGYYVVDLCGKKTLLHRIIAQAFIPNPENKPNIDHINGNPLDNRIENLRWCTQKENLNNPVFIQRHIQSQKGKYGVKSNHHKAIIQFDLHGSLIRKWGCAVDAQKEIGVCRKAISAVLRGKCKTAGGFLWEYYDTDRYLIALMIKTLKERERAA